MYLKYCNQVVPYFTVKFVKQNLLHDMLKHTQTLQIGRSSSQASSDGGDGENCEEKGSNIQVST